MDKKQIFEEINTMLQEGYSPHHVANYILRTFNIELPPVPIEEIVYFLNRKVDYLNNQDILHRWNVTKEFGSEIFSNSDKNAMEFAASLLCPLWLLEPLVICGKRNAKELGLIFNISQNLLNFQLKKLV